MNAQCSMKNALHPLQKSGEQHQYLSLLNESSCMVLKNVIRTQITKFNIIQVTSVFVSRKCLHIVSSESFRRFFARGSDVSLKEKPFVRTTPPLLLILVHHSFSDKCQHVTIKSNMKHIFFRPRYAWSVISVFTEVLFSITDIIQLN